MNQFFNQLKEKTQEETYRRGGGARLSLSVFLKIGANKIQDKNDRGSSPIIIGDNED